MSTELPPNPDDLAQGISPCGNVVPCGAVSPCGVIPCGQVDPCGVVEVVQPCGVIEPCGADGIMNPCQLVEIVTPCGTIDPCGAVGAMNPCQLVGAVAPDALIGENGVAEGVTPCYIIGEEGLRGAVAPDAIIGEEGLRAAVAPDAIIGEEGLRGAVAPDALIGENGLAGPGARPIGRSIPFGLALGAVVIVLLGLSCAFVALGPGKELVQNLIVPVTEAVVTQEVIIPSVVTAPPDDKPTETVTDEPTEVTTGNGACEDSCDPQASNCLTGLDCVPKTTGGSDYICWNQQICTHTTVTEPPDVTEVVSGCGDGLCDAAAGESPVTCSVDCGLCGNGTCDPGEHVFNCSPDCGLPPVDVTTGPAPFCGDAMCNGGETCWTCSWDCGPC